MEFVLVKTFGELRKSQKIFVHPLRIPQSTPGSEFTGIVDRVAIH